MYDPNVHYDESQYREYMYTGLVGHIMKWQHKLVSPKTLRNAGTVLEIGPGFEPHIKYRKINFQQYHCIDNNSSSEIKAFYKNNIHKFFSKIIMEKIPYEADSFDRIVIPHTRTYYNQRILNEMLKVLKKDCVLSIALPCDNGLLWDLDGIFTENIS